MFKKIKNRLKGKKFAPPPPPVAVTATSIGAPSTAQVSGNGSVTTEESDSASGESLEGRMQLQVVLPDGTTVTEAVERRTPMGDLLVQLTKPHKLSPSNHVLNINTEKDSVSYKPNTAIGSLNATVVYVTAKNVIKRNSSSKLPFETTFRLTVHLPHGQLHVLRVSPNVPLSAVLSAVCQERGLVESRYELRHPVYTEERLDYKRSLSDYNLMEVAVVAIKSAAPVPVVTSNDIMAMKARKTSDTGSSRGDSPVRSEASSKRSTSPGRPPRPGKPPALRKRLAPAPPPTSQSPPSQPLKTPPDPDPSPDPVTTSTGGTVTSVSHSRHSSDSSGYHEASILSDSAETPTPTPVIVTSSSSSSVTSVVSVAKKRQAPGPPKPAPRSHVPLRSPDTEPREAPEQPPPKVISPPVTEVVEDTVGHVEEVTSKRDSISTVSSEEEEVVERNSESTVTQDTMAEEEMVTKEEDDRNATEATNPRTAPSSHQTESMSNKPKNLETTENVTDVPKPTPRKRWAPVPPAISSARKDSSKDFGSSSSVEFASQTDFNDDDQVSTSESETEDVADDVEEDDGDSNDDVEKDVNVNDALNEFHGNMNWAKGALAKRWSMMVLQMPQMEDPDWMNDEEDDDANDNEGFSLGEEDDDGGMKHVEGVVENETTTVADGVEPATVDEAVAEDIVSRRSSSSSSRSSKASGDVMSLPAEILALDEAITEDGVTDEKTIAWEYHLPDPPVPPVLPQTPPPPPPPILPEDPPPSVPPEDPPQTPSVPPEDPPQPSVPPKDPLKPPPPVLPPEDPQPTTLPKIPSQVSPSVPPEVPPPPPTSVPPEDPPPPVLPSVPPPPLTPVLSEPPSHSSKHTFIRNEVKDAVAESPIVPVVAPPVEVQVMNGEEEEPKIQKVVTRTNVAMRRGPLVNFSISTYKSRASDGYQYDTPDSTRTESIAEKTKRFSVRTDYEKVEVVPEKRELFPEKKEVVVDKKDNVPEKKVEVLEKGDVVPGYVPVADDGVSETEAQARLQEEYNKLQQQLLEWQKQIMRNQAVLQQQHAVPTSSAESLRQMQEHMTELQKQVTDQMKDTASSKLDVEDVTEEELRTRSLPRPTNAATSTVPLGAATLGRRPGAVRVSVNSWNGRQVVETPMESSRIVPLRTRKDTVEDVVKKVDEPDGSAQVKVVVDTVSGDTGNTGVVIRRKDPKEQDTNAKPQPASANVLVTSNARPVSYAGSSTEAANFSAAFGKPTNKRFTTLVSLMAAQALSNVPKSGTATEATSSSTRLDTKTKYVEPVAARKEVPPAGPSTQPPPPPPPPPPPSVDVEAPVVTRAEVPSRKLVITTGNKDRHSNGDASGDHRQELLSAIGSFGGRSGLKKVPNNEVKSWQMRHGSLDSFA